MSTLTLTREDVVRRLQDAEPAIRGLGVRRLSLFGSVLRGEARPDSDVDFLVEFEPDAKTFEHFMDLGFLLEELLQHRVELVTPESLSPYIGPHILKEAREVLRAA
jgi:predicted nucleotidyltransferase